MNNSSMHWVEKETKLRDEYEYEIGPDTDPYGTHVGRASVESGPCLRFRPEFPKVQIVNACEK